MTPIIKGAGLGLRSEHYPALLGGRPAGLDWLEILSENYFGAGGKPLHFLDRLRAEYPMVMHGVALSIGSADPLRLDHLGKLRDLARRIEPGWISDHLCWTGVGDRQSHDLLPLPMNADVVRHVASRVRQVQDFLGRPLLLENVSSYVRHADDELDEADFVCAVLEEADCQLLLDVNNVYVSGRNHGIDPLAYLDRLPAHRVTQIHLAGHQDLGDLVIDTHDHPVRDEVWSLYRHALRRFGPVPSMIERDDDIPALDDLMPEVQRIAAELAGLARAA